MIKLKYEDQLNDLKERLDRAKNLKYKAEARLEQLNMQKNELLQDLEKEGVKPEELDTEIDKLSKEIEDLFAKAEDMMPKLWFFMKLNQLDENLNRLNEKIFSDQGKVDILKENLENVENNLKEKEDYNEILSKVKILFEETAAYAREQSKKQVEDLVTKCLEFIFETDMEFIIELSTSRDIPVADFYVQNNYPEGYSVKADPELSSGGGVVDIISLALRIAFIQIHKPMLDGPIILDEPGKHVSDDYIFNLGEFLKKSSSLFNRQIIMVTHNKHLSQICDKSFYVTQKNGVSEVTTNSSDNDNLID